MDTIPPLSLPILLDGATGSELYKRGMPAGACTEQWVLGHPEALLELQRGYVAAGSQVLIAPTFGANRVRLEQHGIFGQVADYNRRLVELSRQAAGGRALVAGDMAPTGLFIAPFGESSFEELVAIYTEQAAALAAGERKRFSSVGCGVKPSGSSVRMFPTLWNSSGLIPVRTLVRGMGVSSASCEVAGRM